MIERVLSANNINVKTKITIKSLISLGVIALAVLLPQLVHMIWGQAGGATLLPMYLPVIFGACILGIKWGLMVGVMSPVISFLITLCFSNPMPAAERLPFMVAELSLMALISGSFSKKIGENAWISFAAVILAFAGGRTLFMVLSLIFSFATTFTPQIIWSQIQNGMTAVVIQSLIIPFAVMLLKAVTDKNE